MFSFAFLSTADLIKYDEDLIEVLPVSAVVGTLSTLGDRTMDPVEVRTFLSFKVQYLHASEVLKNI